MAVLEQKSRCSDRFIVSGRCALLSRARSPLSPPYLSVALLLLGLRSEASRRIGYESPSPSELSRQVPHGAVSCYFQAPTRGARLPCDPLITSGEWLCPRPSSSISSVALHDVPIGRGGRRASRCLHDPWSWSGCCKWERTGVRPSSCWPQKVTLS